ncbi:MAG: endoglycosylceramidase [Cryomorphaceae bacterium]|jgi:endoglycosylceramidase
MRPVNGPVLAGAVFLVLLSGCGGGGRSPQAPVIPVSAATDSAERFVLPLAGLHNEDGRLVDSIGRTVVLRGINAVDKTGWNGVLAGPILSASDAQTIAGMGFNHVRLGTTWESLEHERDVFDEAYVEQFLRVLDDLYEAGVLAVVDLHQDVWSRGIGFDGAPAWADPQCNQTLELPLAEVTGTWFAQYGSPATNTAWANFWFDGYGSADLHCTGPIQTEFVDMWRWFASRLAGHPAVVGYDMLNEPWPSAPPGVFEQTQLFPMYARVAAAIRESDTHTPVYFGPPLYSPATPTIALEPPDPNAVFAPHIYTETMFSGGNLSTDAASDEVAIQKDLGDGERMGVPVWIGEWGEVQVADYTTAFYDLLDRYQIGSAFWAYRQRPGEEPRTVETEQPHVRIWVEAWSGDAGWSFDPESGHFELSVTPLPGTHVVRVVVPSRLGLTNFPQGTLYDPVAQRLLWCVEGASMQTLTLGPTGNSSTSSCELSMLADEVITQDVSGKSGT